MSNKVEKPSAILGLALSALFISSCGGSPGSKNQGTGTLRCLLDRTCHTIMVSSHRGYHKYYPENSIAGLKAAAKVGAQFVELDVRHTSDDVLVLMHDSSLDRTTDGTGQVSDHTLAEIQKLTLKGCDPNDPDTCRIPTLEEEMETARQLGMMLYLDQKTDRTDLIVDLIRKGDFFDVSLAYGDLSKVTDEYNQEPKLTVMPSVTNETEFEQALTSIDDLYIVEIGLVEAAPELASKIHEAGVKVQQDMLGTSDIRAALGDYSGWKKMIETGVDLPQTDLPNLMVPAVQKYNESGEFPDKGPPDSM
ncbi:MAG: glycerophosphodiester phosphodiesterase family protein [Deltaproteobacteria bacterium]|nr:glycerophosphodiester phosphodiesterase family protein [Deltaproteobacteria bacterium]